MSFCTVCISVWRDLAAALVVQDEERALARLCVMREEARFWGRNFHEDRPETLRPLETWVERVELELGLRMSPGRYWLGVAIAKVEGGCGSDMNMNDEVVGDGDNGNNDDSDSDPQW